MSENYVSVSEVSNCLMWYATLCNHTFENSGLGKRPFGYQRISEAMDSFLIDKWFFPSMDWGEG